MDTMAPNPRILVVDDRADIRELLETGLTENGYDVDCAQDGPSMRRALAASEVDLVVLDLILPGEPGIALAEFARSKGINVILMSGSPTHLENPPDGFSLLPKPFRIRQLVARIEAVLGGDLPADPPTAELAA
jgi:two-component system OmpR family response regulator